MLLVQTAPEMAPDYLGPEYDELAGEVLADAWVRDERWAKRIVGMRYGFDSTSRIYVPEEGASFMEMLKTVLPEAWQDYHDAVRQAAEQD